MPRVLLTAFGPYDRWPTNASWLALMELTRELPKEWQVTTRRYPVDFKLLRERLAADLSGGFDVALLTGQAPGAGCIQLEAFALNVGGTADQLPEDFAPLAPDGPAAFQSTLPLADWARRLRAAGIPAHVSHHAGTYLCNAALYLAHYFAAKQQQPTRAAFIHLPLDVSQAHAQPRPIPSLPSSVAARGLHLILETLFVAT